MLAEGGAHLSADRVLSRFPRARRGAKPRGAPYTPWQLLEHMRLAQWDILRFGLDPGHESPEWPGGYWPPTVAPPDARAWSRSVAAFREDLRTLTGIARDEGRDLLAPIPHAPGATLLGELYLVASHNSYHLGQLVLLRRMLGSRRRRSGP
jgi:hypothetical protein